MENKLLVRSACKLPPTVFTVFILVCLPRLIKLYCQSLLGQYVKKLINVIAHKKLSVGVFRQDGETQFFMFSFRIRWIQNSLIAVIGLSLRSQSWGQKHHKLQGPFSLHVFLSDAKTCQNLVWSFIYFIVFLLLLFAAINHGSNYLLHVAQQNSEIYVGKEHILRKRRVARIASKVIHVKGCPGP